MYCKAVIFFSVLLFFKTVMFAASPDYFAPANKKSAVRFLKLAENYLLLNNWESAVSQADLGLSYDDSVADLWYVKAAAKTYLGESKSDIIKLLKRAFSQAKWVDYNKDGARILYADLLCDTGEYEESESVINSSPYIYSADAEFIRAKAYYRSGCTEKVENITKARNKINSARKIYPDDMRFARLFFKYEYALRRDNKNLSKKTEENLLVQKIADSFIAKMPKYDNPDAELEIYAAVFAPEYYRKRMLQAFAAHGMEHPLYARAALSAGLMSQQEAWDYFCRFADHSISLEMLEDILPLITEETAIASVKEHLNAFSGILTIDTNKDCEPELTVFYKRGRPKTFFWDRNNDGEKEWTVECDFGVPISVEIAKENVKLLYGTYPYAVKAVYKEEKTSVFNISDETLKWAAFDIKPMYSVKKLFNTEFFIPSVLKKVPELNKKKLLSVCSSHELHLQDKHIVIKFSISDGLPLTADYYKKNIVFAHAVFEQGMPYVRSVDNDGDGIFETTETFSYDPQNKHCMSALDKASMENLFGDYASGVYLKMIQIDGNADTIPDFTEEYLPGNGKISSWDFDGNGEWNVRYKKYPSVCGSSVLIEDAQFYQMPEHKLVTVTLMNGEPVKVQSGNEFSYVIPGKADSFYWIGKEGTADDEYYLLDKFDSSIEQGISVILENGNTKMFAVKIGNNIYGEILPSSNISKLEK